MRENQNIAHCSVCSEKTHCRFSHTYIPHRLHSTESNFQLFLSQNLPNNMGNICMILIQNGRRFITHSPTISSSPAPSWLLCPSQLVSELSQFSPFIASINGGRANRWNADKMGWTLLWRIILICEHIFKRLSSIISFEQDECLAECWILNSTIFKQ